VSILVKYILRIEHYIIILSRRNHAYDKDSLDTCTHTYILRIEHYIIILSRRNHAYGKDSPDTCTRAYILHRSTLGNNTWTLVYNYLNIIRYKIINYQTYLITLSDHKCNFPRLILYPPLTETRAYVYEKVISPNWQCNFPKLILIPSTVCACE